MKMANPCRRQPALKDHHGIMAWCARGKPSQSGDVELANAADNGHELQGLARTLPTKENGLRGTGSSRPRARGVRTGLRDVAMEAVHSSTITTTYSKSSAMVAVGIRLEHEEAESFDNTQ